MKCPNCHRSLWFVKHQCPFCKTVIQPPAEIIPSSPDSIGNALGKQSSGCPLDPPELSDQFKASLLKLCLADRNIAGLWLAWTSSPNGEPELLASMLLDSPNERSAFGFMQQADALGGPLVSVSILNGIPTGGPFYTRPKVEGITDIVPDLKNDASPAPPPERRGQVIIHRCRNPLEASLLIEELAREDILGILPPEEITRYHQGCRYVEIQVSAAAYESATDLRNVVEFNYQVQCAKKALPLQLRLFAFVLGILVIPGILIFLVQLYSFRNCGYEKMAKQALTWYSFGLVLVSAFFVWISLQH